MKNLILISFFLKNGKSLKNFICENENVKISQIELIYEKGLIRVSLNFFSENSIIPDKKING
ncbi:MAG: hypothetical protein LBU84_17470, partial [Prevotella sp.]|nr:hypothetical protein [Prevotella sp.]